jgi:hypothetical protein
LLKNYGCAVKNIPERIGRKIYRYEREGNRKGYLRSYKYTYVYKEREIDVNTHRKTQRVRDRKRKIERGICLER